MRYSFIFQGDQKSFRLPLRKNASNNIKNHIFLAIRTTWGRDMENIKIQGRYNNNYECDHAFSEHRVHDSQTQRAEYAANRAHVFDNFFDYLRTGKIYLKM